MKKWKSFLPGIGGLFCLLLIEIINTIGIVNQQQKENFQTISNILLLIIGSIGVFYSITEKESSGKYELLQFISNFLTIVSAYVLNIDVFGNNIQKFFDLFTGWHIMWFLWSVALILLFSGAGIKCYELIQSIFHYFVEKTRDSVYGIENAIRKSHKGVFFSVFAGAILWLVFLGIGNTGNWIVKRDIPENSLLFWFFWCMICMLIAFFGSLLPKIKQSVDDLRPTRILKYFMLAVIILAVLFVAVQIFPSLFHMLGTIFSYLALFFLFIATLLYAGKQIPIKLKLVCWKDICFVTGIVMFVTFVLLPFLGSSTPAGEAVLGSDQIEYITKFTELFTAGLELAKTFL